MPSKSHPKPRGSTGGLGDAARAGANSSFGSGTLHSPDLIDVFKAQQRQAAAASNYAGDMLAAAATACADVLAMRLPAGSRSTAHRSFERELLREFRDSYARFSDAWEPPPSG